MTALLSDVLSTNRRFTRSYFLIVIIFASILFFIYYLNSETFNEVTFTKKNEAHRSHSFLDARLAQINNEKPALWPEDDPNDDRILAQLAVEVDADAPVKTIYIAPGDFDVLDGEGYDLFIDKQCKTQRCFLTRTNMQDADAVLWRHRIDRQRINVRPEQIWIIFSLESPFHQGFVKYDRVVNWTATYRRDSDIVTPYGKWVYYDNNVRSKKNKTKNYAEGKTKKVAMFVSNCNHQNNNRINYAKALGKYIEVDIYGRCGKDTCGREREKECFEMLQKTYKFYLSFENSNCRDYITEKFFVNGLKSDIIPIVMGAYPEDYLTSGPEHSYIHVNDFPSVEALAEYLHLLDSNDDMYNSYFEWKGTGEFIDTKFFCRLCAMLHTPRSPKTYESFNNWWNGEGVCPPKPRVKNFLGWRK